MKLKLRSHNIEHLKTTLLLISHLRRFVILRFTASQLWVISNKDSPQAWCKLDMSSVFDQIEVQSIRDNTIVLELNIELLLQTLRNFDRAHTDGLFIRLQRKDASGGEGTNSTTSRTASLALFYSNTNANANTINHTFRIPVRILKTDLEHHQPRLSVVDLMVKIPHDFFSTYKRLDKFKKAGTNDMVTIKASRRNGGFLGFVLEEDGKFRITISWNDKLQVHKPTANEDGGRDFEQDPDVDDDDPGEDRFLSVRLVDWRMASKLVAACKSVVLQLAPEACILHCYVDESDDVDIMYYISGYSELT